MSTSPLGGQPGRSPIVPAAAKATPPKSVDVHLDIDSHVVLKGDQAKVEFTRIEVQGGSLAQTTQQLQGLSQKVRNQVMKQIIEQAGGEIARQLSVVLVKELVAQKIPPKAAQEIAERASQEAVKAVASQMEQQLSGR